MAEIVDFPNGRTSHSAYACDRTRTARIIMRRLAAPCRWNDLETIFGFRYYALSEIFLESLDYFIEDKKHVIETFRSDMKV